MITCVGYHKVLQAPGPPEVPSEFIFVSSVADLPAPSAGVITLAASKSYFFVTAVDLEGSRLVCSENTTLLGASSENSRIYSTGLTDPLISSAYSLPIKNLTISGSLALDLDALANPGSALDWLGVNFTDCEVIGSVKNYNNFVMTESAFLNSGGLSFDGTFATIAFNTCLFDGRASSTTITVEPTATISRRFRVVYSSFIALSGEGALSSDAGSFALPESYILDTCNFAGGGTYLTGITHDDNESLFINCVGIDNSGNIAQYYMEDNAVSTDIVTQDVYVKIAGTTIPGSFVEKFSLATTNRAVFIGAIQGYYKVTAVATVTGTSNAVACIKVYLDGAPIAGSKVCATMSASGRAENITCQSITQLATNQYVEIWIANSTGTQDFTVTNLNVTVERLN